MKNASRNFLKSRCKKLTEKPSFRVTMFGIGQQKMPCKVLFYCYFENVIEKMQPTFCIEFNREKKNYKTYESSSTVNAFTGRKKPMCNTKTYGIGLKCRYVTVGVVYAYSHTHTTPLNSNWFLIVLDVR